MYSAVKLAEMTKPGNKIPTAESSVPERDTGSRPSGDRVPSAAPSGAKSRASSQPAPGAKEEPMQKAVFYPAGHPLAGLNRADNRGLPTAPPARHSSHEEVWQQMEMSKDGRTLRAEAKSRAVAEASSESRAEPFGLFVAEQ